MAIKNSEDNLATWLELCSVALWCGLLSPAQAEQLDEATKSVEEDWRVPIRGPHDLCNLQSLWMESSYDILRDQFGWSPSCNEECFKLGRFYLHLKNNNLFEAA